MTGNGHPIHRVDDVVHQRVRLGILTILDALDEADFGTLQEQLDLTAGNLSRHLRVLEEAGMVAQAKAFEGRRPRTYVAITDVGTRALREEVAALRAILGSAALD